MLSKHASQRRLQETNDPVKLNLGKLGAQDLKTLYTAVKNERERRGRKNPSNHSPEEWVVPNEAIERSRRPDEG